MQKLYTPPCACCEWHIEIGGYRETKGNVWQLDDYIEAYLTQGAKIDVHDENDSD